MVLIVGDFVDDDTTKEDMIACCKALGELDTTYGVYYVFGNHDKADKFYIIGRQDKSEEYAEKKSHNGRTDGKP